MNKYKTFAPRFLALILDTILLLPLAIAADSIADSTLTEGQRTAFLAILNLANVIYFVVLHGLYGQTVGKYLMRVKVVDNLNESRIGFRQAALRNSPQIALVVASIFPAMNMTLGGTPDAPVTPLSLLLTVWGLADLIVFLMSPKSRALHDLIAGTIVVRLEKSNQTAD